MLTTANGQGAAVAENERHEHKGWTVELTSYRVEQEPSNPAGWVP
jgi:hypothetical protein